MAYRERRAFRIHLQSVKNIDIRENGHEENTRGNRTAQDRSLFMSCTDPDGRTGLCGAGFRYGKDRNKSSRDRIGCGRDGIKEFRK